MEAGIWTGYIFFVFVFEALWGLKGGGTLRPLKARRGGLLPTKGLKAFNRGRDFNRGERAADPIGGPVEQGTPLQRPRVRQGLRLYATWFLGFNAHFLSLTDLRGIKGELNPEGFPLWLPPTYRNPYLKDACRSRTYWIGV